MERIVDVLIIGGGINGCGCAADAAQRGLSVLLCEKDDLASKTSSNSSKLIHGGLRYLEQYHFPLVKHALDERQRLLNLAPHLIHPLSFVLPLTTHSRNHFLLAAGLFLYDRLSFKNTLPHHQKIRRQTSSNLFMPLQDPIQKGFLFYDCQTDDARLVITNALQAKAHGAEIMTQTSFVKAHAIDNQWHVTLRTREDKHYTVRARALINAAGAWVQEINQLNQIDSRFKTTLVQGSHLVVPKLYSGDHAYVLQDDGKRIVFVMPYHHHYTLIGTTEHVFKGDLDKVTIREEETRYLCTIIQQYFKQSITPKDCLATSTGVRTLVFADKNPTQLSRDYAYQYTTIPAPAISIFSGKITTYRQLSERIINALAPIFPHMKPCRTANTPLVGSTWNNLHFNDYKTYYHATYSWLATAIKSHYLETYGTQCELLLSQCTTMTDLGIHFGNVLYQREVDYLVRAEWARTAEDILWRRTKLGLVLKENEREKLAQYLERAIN